MQALHASAHGPWAVKTNDLTRDQNQRLDGMPVPTDVGMQCTVPGATDRHRLGHGQCVPCGCMMQACNASVYLHTYML